MRLLVGVLAVILVASAHATLPPARRCARVCPWAALHCGVGSAKARCRHGVIPRCQCNAGRRAPETPTSTTVTTSSTSTSSTRTTSTSTTVTTTTSTSTQAPDITGWYRGVLTQGSQCLDDPGHTGYQPEPFELTAYFAGFAQDPTAHFTLTVPGPVAALVYEGGWDTGGPAALTAPSNDPECPLCTEKYYGTLPPACGGDCGTTLVAGPSDDGLGLFVLFYFGPPWLCHDDFSGILLPIDPPN